MLAEERENKVQEFLNCHYAQTAAAIWDLFFDTCGWDFNLLTDVLTTYILFCEDTVTQTKQITTQIIKKESQRTWKSTSSKRKLHSWKETHSESGYEYHDGLNPQTCSGQLPGPCPLCRTTQHFLQQQSNIDCSTSISSYPDITTDEQQVTSILHRVKLTAGSEVGCLRTVLLG